MMGACFFWNFTLNPPETQEVFRGMVPSVPSYGLHTAVGIVGSIILPQNYYVHSAVVLSREVDRNDPRKVREANKYLFADAALALFVAFIINFAVVGCFAELFFDRDCAAASTVSACLDSYTIKETHDVYGNCTLSGQAGQCQQIGLRDADNALRMVLGSTASLIWAIGLLASGQSSTMTLTYAGQFITEGFGGFMLPVHYRVLICRSVSIVPALIAALLEATHPTIMDELTQWGNIISSCCVPFAVLPMLKFCSSPKLMGEHILDRNISRGMWCVSWALIVLNMMVIWETILSLEEHISKIGSILLVVVSSFFYVYFSYLMVEEEIKDNLKMLYNCLFLGRDSSLDGSGKSGRNSVSDDREGLLQQLAKCVNVSVFHAPDSPDVRSEAEMSDQSHTYSDSWNFSNGKLLRGSKSKTPDAMKINNLNSTSSTAGLLSHAMESAVISTENGIHNHGKLKPNHRRLKTEINTSDFSDDNYALDVSRSILSSIPSTMRV